MMTPTKLKLDIVGSNKFGRITKISAEKTYNMFISDEWLVSLPGHLKVVSIAPLQEGRGLFVSNIDRGNFMLEVIGDGVYVINNEIKKIGRTIPIGDVSEKVAIRVGTIDTSSGDVFIAENNAEQIGICDKNNIYIYDYRNNVFQKIATDFKPGFIIFQDGYFIAPDSERNQWRLSGINNGFSWPAGVQNVGEFQTEANNVRACVRVPGKGNKLLVMGSTVTESWNDVGYNLFPYYRTNSSNIDYGCVNQATIATSDKFVVWLAGNSKSAPVIMVSDGSVVEQISTDGINFLLATQPTPEDSYGFLWKVDGHLMYQLTFRTDQVTYLYDFTTQKFFFYTDAYLSNHIAKKVVFFAGDYYFISFIDGNVYRLSSELTTFDGTMIPRIRITNTIRMPDNKTFVGRSLGFTLEQGEQEITPKIDIALSYDGGVSYSNFVRKELNPIGNRRNIFNAYGLGRGNEITPQFRFLGDGGFNCTGGYMEAYQ